MTANQGNLANRERRINWEKLRQGFRTVPEAEREQFERAALQMRARLVRIPYYAERDSRYGMRYWHTLLACEYPVG